ncbi:MAG: DUF3277 family protein [bacterium]|nr:DUF3277 family protein [bacterium]
MGKFANYTFSNVNVIFGILELEGYGDGNDVVIIDSDADQFKKLVGAKGDIARSQTNDNSCTITIKLLQTSDSNAALNALYLVDKATGAGSLPMIINDKETDETYIISNAWIMKPPRIVRGQEVNNMEWIFQGDNLALQLL